MKEKPGGYCQKKNIQGSRTSTAIGRIFCELSGVAEERCATTATAVASVRVLQMLSILSISQSTARMLVSLVVGTPNIPHSRRMVMKES